MIEHKVKISTILEPEREIPILAKADVVVAGGGPAGLAAAIASARAGADTILVEEKSFLGGVATANMMTALVGSRRAYGIALELMDRMAEMGGAPKWEPDKRINETTPFDAECFKDAALDMCIEAGVKLYFYTKVCQPIIEDSRVTGVIIESKTGRQAILGKTVIDCTSDADLATRAGCPVTKGRESDNKMRPFALLFLLGGIDIDKLLKYVEENPDQLQPQHLEDTHHSAGGERVITRISGFYDFVEQAKAAGELYDNIHYFRLETLWRDRGIALCNTTRIYYVDGTDIADLTKGEIEGRNQIKKLLPFARKYIPGCENAYIIGIANYMGIRETRRIIGEHHLSDDDAFSDRQFDDSIVTMDVTLPPRDRLIQLDVHMPDPIEGSDLDLFEKYPDQMPREPHNYQIPYRTLVPKGVGGLLVAGKTISVSHLIEGTVRGMIFCMLFGQVAGVAAAMCAKEGINPKDLCFESLKKELISQGYNKF